MYTPSFSPLSPSSCFRGKHECKVIVSIRSNHSFQAIDPINRDANEAVATDSVATYLVARFFISVEWLNSSEHRCHSKPRSRFRLASQARLLTNPSPAPTASTMMMRKIVSQQFSLGSHSSPPCSLQLPNHRPLAVQTHPMSQQWMHYQ